MFTKMWLAMLMAVSSVAMASNGYLVKLKDTNIDSVNLLSQYGGKLEVVSKKGRLLQWTRVSGLNLDEINKMDGVEFIEENRTVSLIPNPSLESQQKALWENIDSIEALNVIDAFEDNPAVNAPATQSAGADPLLADAWGLAKIGGNDVVKKAKGGEGIIVAVTDTGVDYNHADLINNMWRNEGEIDGDGIDNDNNGFVDDVVGWDFAKDDNLPYDLSLDLMAILFSGGNPGHGTHCAGVVGAIRNNSQGIAGVSHKVQLMAVRMISENGQGDLAGGVKAIDYAVENGAHVISASWGSMGEEEGSTALREALQRAEDAGVLFVAAAGNGKQGVGYDNDTDAQPVYPSSYDHDNIISVAALDVSDALGAFSNWGKKSVDLGAPGVKVLSTVPGDRYQDTIIELGSMKVTWDGTSMATPHVSGAIATLWSNYPEKDWKEIKALILSNTSPISALSGKATTDGMLNLRGLFN